ncbi:hypothetical protein MLP_45810 [Microlunatus phosphovorus NM-1]|uniref:Uncharacterized protein n=1 Tax=Microlunatus phosphovorus (strain ATCC 700054 / DSM 10555 / JCM 9379 / NBRC 101784 / NCIMB 13414 / VKM Ac-1990 / NM-1) TaxID=1032480 RepID=F5XE47_MICPN|nr:hypothetical protein [Microlunatus phosphovorus]BAK37595.1 hypothetical protein MLP_45810 [Microlunatus phosphovorus NM-1]
MPKRFPTDRGLWISALPHLSKRAERSDEESLRSTFVHLAGLAPRLRNEEHQILFGRRGTGKTHALNHLKQELLGDDQPAIYIDLRLTGSAGGYYLSAEAGRGLAALHVIVDIISEVHTALYAISLDLLDKGEEITALVNGMDKLAAAATEITTDGSVTVANEVSRAHTATSEFAFTVSEKGLQAAAKLGDELQAGEKLSRQATGTERPVLNFTGIARSLQSVVSALPTGRLWILIDEWSAMPLDIQPIVADFFRRCFLPCRGMILKLAAVERRSRFFAPGVNGYIGVELGSDISAGLDLDSYLTDGLTSRTPSTEFYEHLIKQHVRAYYTEKYSGDWVAEYFQYETSFHTDFPAFSEAIYFAAGIPRDLLAICSIAAQRCRPAEGITLADIASASRQYFIQEKEAQARLSPRTRSLSGLLRDFAESGQRRFMIDRDHSHEEPELLDLLDQRIVHLIERGIGPRGKFDVFAIDLGMVADQFDNSDGRLLDRKNPWANWDHVRSDQKLAPVLEIDGPRITWH